MNLANKLTLTRILLIPAFVYVLMSNIPNNVFIALVIFAVASITDFLDGYVARKYNMVSKLGKFMDPLADKLLVMAAFVCLVELGKASAWIVILILSREFIVSVFRAVAASEGIVIAASKWGKYKTNSQIFAIIFILLQNYPFSLFTTLPVDQITLYIAAILTVLSGFDYIWKNKNVLV